MAEKIVVRIFILLALLSSDKYFVICVFFQDEQQEHEQQSDFIKESFKILEKDGTIDVNMFKELAKKYNVQLK